MATTETDTPTTPIGPPRPMPDDLTRFFWEGVDAHELRILRCDNCQRYIHWPKVVCRFCLSTDLSPARVSGRGTVATFTLPLQPFHPYFRDKIPYDLAVVELEEQEGLKLVTNIVDIPPEDVRVGLPVEVAFREVAPGLTLPLFRPAGATGA
ncbi:MAG: Zn-ribbon domain-containing OB-fold protein [Acidimicrobiia bacterium]